MMEEPFYKTCTSCGDAGPHKFVMMDTGVLYAKYVCGECSRWITWVQKPDSDPTKYKRPNQHRDLVKEFSRGFCEMCLCRSSELPKGQTLEAQHVLEYAEHNGSSERENIWILCTGCHRMVHWIRTYHGGDMRMPFEPEAHL